MRLYFDTNVYSMIAAREEANRVRQMLLSAGWRVLTSLLNAIEIYAIPSTDRRVEEIEVLSKLASEFPKRPVGYEHAREVRGELRRLRPSWVRRVVFDRAAKNFLKEYREHCRRIREASIPPRSAYEAYRSVAEPGIAISRLVQKSNRQVQRQPGATQTLTLLTEEGETTISDRAFTDVEAGWRTHCLTAWHDAIVRESPWARDYADYLGPHLKPHAFHDLKSLASFWLDEVEASRVPRNRICGLVSHFQPEHRIGHGNPGDELHAIHILDVDVFITADKAFASVLEDVARVVDGAARISLIDRGANSAADEIERAVRGAEVEA